MSVVSIQQQDPTIASRYLADQLSEEQRREFESRLISDPQALRELEATARLKIGLEKLRNDGRMNALVSEQSSRSPWLLRAAAAAAMLILSVSVMRGTDDRASMLARSLATLKDERGALLQPGSTYALLRTRGVHEDAVIRLPHSRQAIELRVLPDLPDSAAAPYRVVLTRVDAADTQPVAVLDDLHPAADGFVSIFIDSARVTAGEFMLDVSDSDAGQAGTTFRIRFTSD